jgi:hypothetical protein
MAPLKSRIFSIDNNSEWLKFSFIHWNRYKSTGISWISLNTTECVFGIPQACLEMISCQCSTGCITLRCSCKEAKLPCTDLCKCHQGKHVQCVNYCWPFVKGHLGVENCKLRWHPLNREYFRSIIIQNGYPTSMSWNDIVSVLHWLYNVTM